MRQDTGTADHREGARRKLAWKRRQCGERRPHQSGVTSAQRDRRGRELPGRTGQLGNRQIGTEIVNAPAVLLQPGEGGEEPPFVPLARQPRGDQRPAAAA